MAGDTFTNFLNLTKPEVGGSRDQWGTKGNTNYDIIDNWAKAVDKLAKDALSKPPVYDANNALVKQVVQGPVQFTGAHTIDEDPFLTFANKTLASRIDERAAAYADDRLNSAKAYTNTETAKRLSLANGGTVEGATYFGQETAFNRGIVANHFNANGNGSYIRFFREGVGNRRLEAASVRGPGLVFINLDGQGKFEFRDDGDIYFDLWKTGISSRIDTRAASYADDRLATAKKYTNDIAAAYMPLAGGRFVGNVSSTNSLGSDSELYVNGYNGTNPQLRFYRDGTGNRFIKSTDDSLYMQKNSGDLTHRFYDTGAFWTAEIGDLNGRIEARAAAYADDRLNAAKAYTDNTAGGRMPIAGGRFTGPVDSDAELGSSAGLFANGYGGGDPQVRLYKDGAGNRFIKASTGRLYFQMLNGSIPFQFRDDGDIDMSLFGSSLNSRIETRAAAYAADAASSKVSNYNGSVRQRKLPP